VARILNGGAEDEERCLDSVVDESTKKKGHSMTNHGIVDNPYSPQSTRMEYQAMKPLSRSSREYPKRIDVPLPRLASSIRSSHPQMEEHFRQGKRLRRRHYSSRDIPRVLQEQSRTPLFARLTMDSLEILNSPTNVRSRDESKNLLERWAKVLDEAFFSEV
jgi:hypothetical protein